MLPCGHSFCQNCLLLTFHKSKPKKLTCPSCQQEHSMPSEAEILKLIKNYALLSLIETKRPPSNNLLKQHSIQPSKHQLIEEEMKGAKSDEEGENPPLLAPKVKPGQKCPKHDLLIHSYHKSTGTLLCTKCVYSQNIQQQQIEIIPHVVKEIKRHIESTRILILYRRSQLYQALKYLERMQRGNKEVIEAKVKEHFNKIRKVVDTIEAQTNEQLVSLADKQAETLQTVQTQVEEQLDGLYNDDLNLSSLESHEDQEIVYMMQIIDDQRQKLVNFKPDISLEDISIALQLRESSYEKVSSLLTSTCSLMLDFLRFDDNTPIKFDHILDKEKFWVCISCSKKLSNDDIFCSTCNVFKPLEMFKNLIHQPMRATDEEIMQLNKRRKAEKELIFEKENSKHVENMFFIISTNWLIQWKCFISNKSVAKIDGNDVEYKDQLLTSENPSIGVLPPGPISNFELILDPNSESIQVKESLLINKDYRGVTKEVWQIFQKMYGGGPIIARKELDIYSEDPVLDKIKKDSPKKGGIIGQNESKQQVNIFQRKSAGARDSQGSEEVKGRENQPSSASQRKKRNLFASENIKADADEGVPEEVDEVGIAQKMYVPLQGPARQVGRGRARPEDMVLKSPLNSYKEEIKGDK